MRHLLGHTTTSKLKFTVKKLNELNSAGNIQFLTIFSWIKNSIKSKDQKEFCFK